MNAFFKNIAFVSTLVFGIISFDMAYSQSPDDGNIPEDVDSPAPEIPIDGGITYLAAAGMAYGTKKLLDARKRKSIK